MIIKSPLANISLLGRVHNYVEGGGGLGDFFVGAIENFCQCDWFFSLNTAPVFLSLPQGSLCVTTRLGGGEKGACREREAKREEGPRLLLFPSSPRAYYFCLTVAQKTPTFPFFLNRKLNLTSMAVKTRTTNSITSTWHVHQAFGRILDIVFF